MSPEAVTAAGMVAVVIIDRAPELARIWAADRKDKRAKKQEREAAS